MKVIEMLNPWWKEGEVRKELVPEFKRNLFSEILKYLKVRQIIAVVGLRRTGKTTLMYQVIDYLIKRGINPLNILYFSFDESSISLEELFDFYEKEILLKSLQKEKIFVFLDEIQKLKDWQNKLKIYYDAFPNMKFFVSGSASLNVMLKAKESLAGRIFYFYLTPLLFEEFLELKGKDIKKIRENVRLWKREVEIELNNYLLRPFPEIINANETLAKRYLKEGIIDMIVLKDITQLFNVREPEIVGKIVEIIANMPGIMINLNEVANELAITRQALSNYLFYLENGFLIKSLRNFKGSRRASSRKLKRYYPSHPCFSLVYGFEEKGKIAENLVLFESQAKYYWREGNKEVDFVVNGKDVVGIEVKYRKKIGKNEIRNISYFEKKFKPKKILIITEDIEKKENKIEYVPLWKYILK